MIFGAELLPKVLDGTKTMTRRKFRPKGRSYQPGRLCAVQPGRGKAAVAYIRLDSVHIEELGRLTEDDARREGFPNSVAFGKYWIGLYGDIDWQEEVYVLEFHVERPIRASVGA